MDDPPRETLSAAAFHSTQHHLELKAHAVSTTQNSVRCRSLMFLRVACNLGWVEGNKTTAEVGINSCVALSFDRNAGVEASDCMCCAMSSVLSG